MIPKAADLQNKAAPPLLERRRSALRLPSAVHPGFPLHLFVACNINNEGVNRSVANTLVKTMQIECEMAFIGLCTDQWVAAEVPVLHVL